MEVVGEKSRRSHSKSVERLASASTAGLMVTGFGIPEHRRQELTTTASRIKKKKARVYPERTVPDSER